MKIQKCGWWRRAGCVEYSGYVSGGVEGRAVEGWVVTWKIMRAD